MDDEITYKCTGCKVETEEFDESDNPVPVAGDAPQIPPPPIPADALTYDDCTKADADAAEQYARCYVASVGAGKETMIDAVSTLYAQVATYGRMVAYYKAALAAERARTLEEDAHVTCRAALADKQMVADAALQSWQDRSVLLGQANQEITELRAALAAAREENQTLCAAIATPDVYAGLISEITECDFAEHIKQLRQQLAAERQRTQDWRVVETVSVVDHGDGEMFIVMSMSDGSLHCIPKLKLQGVADLSNEEAAQVEITGGGTGLRWSSIDMDLYVPALLHGVYGTKLWMERLSRPASTGEPK
jgi:precorrin-6B methylase 2